MTDIVNDNDFLYQHIFRLLLYLDITCGNFD